MRKGTVILRSRIMCRTARYRRQYRRSRAKEPAEEEPVDEELQAIQENIKKYRGESNVLTEENVYNVLPSGWTGPQVRRMQIPIL